MAPSKLCWKNLKTQKSPAILDLCLRKTRAGKSRDYRDVIVFEKLRFHDFRRPHENPKPAFSNSSGLKSVCEKLRQFSWLDSVDGRPNRRNKAAFSNFVRISSQISKIVRKLPVQNYTRTKFWGFFKNVNIAEILEQNTR